MQISCISTKQCPLILENSISQQIVVKWTQIISFHIFSDFLYLQLKSAAAQFEVIINALFCPCMRNLNTKQHVKPHVYCFLSFDNFWQQFWSEFDMKKPVQEMFTFWS